MRVDKSRWHRDLLGNLCNIKRGGSPRPIQKFLTDAPDGINWIKIGDAGDSKFISSCKEKIIPEGVSKSRFVHKGDFLLSNSMSFGRPYILNVDGCIHDGWLVLEQPKQFDKSYLYYLLGSAPMYEKFAQKAQGAVVNNLNIDRVASVEIIYPPLDIQQAIAAELDAVQAMIDGYKAQIADLDVLAQSIFLDMFGDPISNPKGWEKNFMGNLFSIKRGGSPRPIKKYLTTSPDGINWIKIGDTDKSMFISSCKEKIIPEGKSKSRFVHQGDFLLSNSMSFGKPYILKVDGCIHDGWLVIEQSPKFESYVLYFILNSPSLYEVFTNKAKGAVVNNLNIDLVSSVEIPTPPIKLQQHFATQVEAIEQQKELLRQQLADAENLMAERMQYYFS